MRKNRFLALTMLCSVLSGVSANAQEVKNSGSQTTGEVKNSSGNKGTPNSDKNVEKVTKKDPNSKKIESGNSSGSKKSDAKKDDKEITKDKTKGSGEVSSKSFEWEDFKKRFGDGVSSFVDLVKRHPVWSSIIGTGGGITIEEGVRRTCFKPKNNNPPKNDNPQPDEVWGVNKFGYNKQKNCIYRNPNEKDEKIKVILVGSQKALSSVQTDELVEELKKVNANSEVHCKVSEDRIAKENLEIERLKLNVTDPNNLVKKSKESGCYFVLFVYKKEKLGDFGKYDSINWKANVFVDNNLYEGVNFCNVSDFSTKK